MDITRIDFDFLDRQYTIESVTHNDVLTIRVYRKQPTEQRTEFELGSAMFDHLAKQANIEFYTGKVEHIKINYDWWMRMPDLIRYTAQYIILTTS